MKMARAHRILWAGVFVCGWLGSACSKTCLNPQPEPPGDDCTNAARGGTGGAGGGGSPDAGGGGGVITIPDAGARIDVGNPTVDATSDAPADGDATTVDVTTWDAAEEHVDAVDEPDVEPPNDDVTSADAPPPSDPDASEGGSSDR
jgi:hypothetical protein